MICRDFNPREYAESLIMESCLSDPDYRELAYLNGAHTESEIEAFRSIMGADRLHAGMRVVEAYVHSSAGCCGNIDHEEELQEVIADPGFPLEDAYYVMAGLDRIDDLVNPDPRLVL
jgi:hypothetical protein